MEVQERLGPTVEDARSLFDQSVNRAKSIEQCGQSFECGLRGVLHRGECSATFNVNWWGVGWARKFHVAVRPRAMRILRLLW